MADEVVNWLAQVPLFSGIPKRALKRLAESGREVDHAPGHEVAVEGLAGYGFHLILRGSAHVDVRGAHRPDLGPGDYFGEISLIDGKPRSATVTAGNDGLKAYAIPSFGFQTVLKEEPGMAQALLVNLCARVRRIESDSQQ
jgi:CRP/FNR family cyclic AMP-dependent transcriptional regulator